MVKSLTCLLTMRAVPLVTAGTLDITRDYGESNESFLSVPVGDIIAAAIQQKDIVLTGAAASPMVMPEELATAMNKYFAGGYAAATPALAAPTGTNARSFDDLQVEYDFARQALRITQSGDDTLHFTTDAPLTGSFLAPTSVSPHQVMQLRDRRL